MSRDIAENDAPMTDAASHGLGNRHASAWVSPPTPTAAKSARLIRTTYAVTVEHRDGEEPILNVSEGARIVSVHFYSRVTPSGSGVS